MFTVECMTRKIFNKYCIIFKFAVILKNIAVNVVITILIVAVRATYPAISSSLIRSL
jgi:hypothetical protein